MGIYGNRRPAARRLGLPRSSSSAWKPALLALAVGYGVWFGLDLLHKPEKKSEPPKHVHWSSGEVILSPQDVQPAQEVPDGAGGVERLPPATDGQVSEPLPVTVPAGGRLARTLSELLGVEISIRADQKVLEKGLVLHEQGKGGSGWQIVLSEPKAPAANPVQPGTEPKKKGEPPKKKEDEADKRPFELTPGSEP